jgi:hypothetical protein
MAAWRLISHYFERAPRSLNRTSIETGISMALPVLMGGTSAAKGKFTMATEFAHGEHAHSEGQGRQGDSGSRPQASFGCVSMDGGGFDGGVRHDADDGQQARECVVGQWAPTCLILGLYNKLVKELRSDRTQNAV